MAVCGVIAEYDPFHRGHERHLYWARRETGADSIVVVMSGSFTQRGAPALLPAHARAEMALQCGADVVLQLPYAFSVREAEYFALGGVGILNALGPVTHLCFGSETADMEILYQAARLLESPDASFTSALQSGLERGLSFASAQGQALNQRMQAPSSLFSAPNTALALSYMRALLRLKSPIIPAAVKREGEYHDAELSLWPSASAVRKALLRGDWQGVEKAVPKDAMPILQRAVLDGCCPPDGLDSCLLFSLLHSSAEEIALLPGVDEGLEKRILKAAAKARTREEMIDLIKTRRYTRGRISRALCHCLMQVKKNDLPLFPDHARILGFRESARPLLRKMQSSSSLPLLTRPAREPLAQLDLKADQLWLLAAGRPPEDAFKASPVIVP